MEETRSGGFILGLVLCFGGIDVCRVPYRTRTPRVTYINLFNYSVRQTQTQRETVSGWPFASDWSNVSLLCIDHFGPLRQGDVRHGLIGRNYGRRRVMEGGRESAHCTTIYNLIRQQT